MRFEDLQAFAREFVPKKISLTVVKHGNTYPPGRSAHRTDETVHRTIFAQVYLVQEMSPQTSEDHSYLFEQEWRIVEGLDFRTAARISELTQDEKQTFCRETRLGAVANSCDVNIAARYSAAPVIDSFRYFKGVPGKPGVAELIETFFVPDGVGGPGRPVILLRRTRTLFGEVEPTITYSSREDTVVHFVH